MSIFPEKYPLKCWAARTQDVQLLMASTSGGAFTEIAKVVLSEGGVVFGVVWANDFSHAEYQWAETEVGLAPMRGVKYTVADMSSVYSPMKKFLDCGRKVMFTGTPCQTAAIRKVFGTSPNLLLCALICMSNVDSVIWKQYIYELQNKYKSKVSGVKHRGKIRGKTGFFCIFEFENRHKNRWEFLRENMYIRNFQHNARKCCAKCNFKCGRHAADIQIGDYWGVDAIYPELDDGKGVSAVLAYTEAGIIAVNKSSLKLWPSSYEQILVKNPYIEKQICDNTPYQNITFRERMYCKYLHVRNWFGSIIKHTHD